MPKPTMLDKENLESKEKALQEMRSNVKMKRDTTVVVSSKGFYKTGLMTDIVQHALLLPVLVSHLRFHFSLDYLETKINYKFNNRFLLQQALTHPSYKENFGTNPDHVRNTLSNCGIRQPEYGDKKVHVQSARKRGINVLINIMSRLVFLKHWRDCKCNIMLPSILEHIIVINLKITVELWILFICYLRICEEK